MNALLTDEKLLGHIAMGESYSIIARQYEGVSTGAIAGRVYRMKNVKKIDIDIPVKKFMARRPKLPAPRKPFDAAARAVLPVLPSVKQTNVYFRPRAVAMTKNEMYEMLRKAVENTSRM